MDNRHSNQSFQAESYLAPETLVQLSTLELRARMIVEGIRTGSHTSPHQGMSVEFKQHRQYVPGDDLKHLDWRVLARSDRPTIKQYEQETTLDVSILVDCSASMRFGSIPTKKGWGGTRSETKRKVWTKYDHATAVSAAIAWMSLQQSDRVGVSLFAEDIVTTTPTRSSNDQWRNIITTLSNETVADTTDLERSVEHLLSLTRNRSLFILVSDFLQDEESIGNSIARIRHHKHDLMCIQTLDESELTLNIDESTTFDGLEGEGVIHLDPTTIRETYIDHLNKHNRSIEGMLLDHGYDYQLMNTHKSVGPALTRLAARRMNWLRSRHVR